MDREPRKRPVARLLLLAILGAAIALIAVSLHPRPSGPDGRSATAGALFRQAPKPAG